MSILEKYFKTKKSWTHLKFLKKGKEERLFFFIFFYLLLFEILLKCSKIYFICHLKVE